ncbi:MULTISPECIES: ATP-binding protein [Enorma]|uniref:ATP-binding protein n=1 Tax=Enorma TaxID=1472762 RepID=UPI00034BA5D1|nr:MULTISPECIES: ATP-binding protein [Enorma]
MRAFVDRERELQTLEREYARREASFVVVYGRRRVGKTELISRFIQDKLALYYLATEEPELQNLESFQALAADFLGSDLLRSAHIKRWEDIFRELVRTHDATRERAVIVIDEFQYLGKANPAYPSIFQRIWDTMLKDANVMLILCGSLISLMKDQVLSEESPLYGRRTAQIRMGQITFSHYREFLPGHTMRELVERYAVTGGVPKYIELFEDQDDVFAAISENVLDRNGFLYDEPNFLLSREVPDVGTYFALIRAIAGGARRPSEISRAFGMKQTSLNKYLKTLIDLDVLEREVPVTESNPGKSKKSLYNIKDNFLQFWFKFVLPNLSYLETGRTAAVERRIREHFIDSHVAFVYEGVCRERLWDMADSGVLGFVPERVGRWWSGGDEIDVVGLSAAEKCAVWGECKFWKDPAGANVLRDLENKVARVPWERDGRTDIFVLFSVSGFTDGLHELASTRDDVLLVGD